MGLGNNKKKSSKGKGKKKSSEGRRYVGSVWENEGKDGSEFLSVSIDNRDEDSEYYKGKLIWFDAETEQYYEVKSMAVYGADKGPKNLVNKLVLDIENDYHVDEMDS